MIKIYVANLGKYNEGELVGKWLELPCDMEDFKESFLPSIEIDGLQYEEYAIHDFETDIEGLKIGEYDNIEKLNELAEAYDNLEDSEKKVVAAVIEWGYYGYDNNAIKEAIENIDDFYLMEDITNNEEYGDYILEEGLMGEIPENILMYIDSEAIGRDCYLDGDNYYSSNGLIEKR